MLYVPLDLVPTQSDKVEYHFGTTLAQFVRHSSMWCMYVPGIISMTYLLIDIVKGYIESVPIVAPSESVQGGKWSDR